MSERGGHRHPSSSPHPLSSPPQVREPVEENHMAIERGSTAFSTSPLSQKSPNPLAMKSSSGSECSYNASRGLSGGGGSNSWHHNLPPLNSQTLSIPSPRPKSMSPLPPSRMQYRYLGNSGLRVSAIGLGSWLTFGATVPLENTVQCLRTAYNLGINYFDTAEVYANGQCETVIGMAIQQLAWARSDFVISTKIFWGGNGPNERGLSRKHIIEGLRGSLRRLKLEYVDIVLAHRPDTDTPMEETVRAFNHVIDRGYAMYWGTSEWSPQQITQAVMIADRLGLMRPILEQPQYNMLNRDKVELDYPSLCRDFGLGLATWSPLLSGVLTGKYLRGIADGTRLSISSHVIVNRIRHTLLSTPEGQVTHDKVRRIVSIAEQLGCTPAQLAIAWCLRNRNVSSVITGATRPQQIEENVAALTIASRMNGEWDAVLEDVLGNKPETPFNYRDA